jgi:hypothetical protein
MRAGNKQRFVKEVCGARAQKYHFSLGVRSKKTRSWPVGTNRPFHLIGLPANGQPWYLARNLSSVHTAKSR